MEYFIYPSVFFACRCQVPTQSVQFPDQGQHCPRHCARLHGVGHDRQAPRYDEGQGLGGSCSVVICHVCA